MKITAMQEYGLRCMLQLAAHRSGEPLTVRQIAQSEHLTSVYVAKILVTLRRASLVKSIRGVKGGYALSRPAKQISVAGVLGALGHIDLGKDICQKFTGTSSECTHTDNCSIRPVWGVLTQYIYGFLSQLNLSQLVQDERVMEEEVARLTEQGALPPADKVLPVLRGEEGASLASPPKKDS